MKYKQIMTLFGVILPLSVIVRLFQIMNTVEMTTGFFENEYASQGYLMLGIIAVFCVLTAIFALNSHRTPEHPPRTNIFLALSSILFAVSLLYEVYTETLSLMVLPWQAALLKLLGTATAVYFIIYALGGFVRIKLPKLCAVIPVAYFIVRIICAFISISSLALISDNIFLMAVYCMCLLFMLNFAKLYNGLDSEYNFRKILATGLVSVILCFTESVPHLIINIIEDGMYQHTSLVASASVLFTGIFILSFLLSHFSSQNCSPKGSRVRTFFSEN